MEFMFYTEESLMNVLKWFHLSRCWNEETKAGKNTEWIKQHLLFCCSKSERLKVCVGISTLLWENNAKMEYVVKKFEERVSNLLDYLCLGLSQAYVAENDVQSIQCLYMWRQRVLIKEPYVRCVLNQSFK